MTDQITLTMPRERRFFGVARLVLAELATRLDVTVESLDELELALDGLLERRDGGQEVTVSLDIDDNELHATVGPFSGSDLRAELEEQARRLALAPAARCGRRRVLGQRS